MMADEEYLVLNDIMA